MKKTLLLTIMCVFALFGNVNAQDEIVVGDQVTLSWANPIADYYNYSVCQQIYTAKELQGKAGIINKISFEHATGVSATRDILVYMKNIDKESFTGNKDWVEVSDSDIVYNGSWAIPSTFSTPINVAIDLTKDFEYTGGDLLLCVCDETGVEITENFNQFYCTKNEERVDRALCYYSSSAIDMTSLSTIEGNLAKYTNNIRFTLVSEGGEEPGDGVEELRYSFNICPNPVNDMLYIEAETEIKEVAIYTITGVMVYNEQCTINNLQLNVTNLNSGVYFVKVITDNGELVKKFVKK